MKTIKNLFSVVIFTFILFSCSESVIDMPTYKPDIESLDINSANEEFAKILAKAVQDQEIRKFIKAKSLVQVDKDYDVIYHLIKNDKLESGTTFREALSKYSYNIENLDKITSYDQRLTILVPYYDSLRNAEKWDINNDISPKIVLRDWNISRDTKELKCFDAKGNISNIKRHGIPDEYMLVVKSNERLISHNNTSRLKRTENVGKGLENEDGVFAYFMNEEFDNLNKENNLKRGLWKCSDFYERTQKTLYPYWNNMTYPRDYIYYGINPTTTQGYLKTDYAEHLSSINFNSTTSYPHVVESQDITEGSLEMIFDFIFCRRDGNAFNLKKVVHIPIRSLFSVTNGTVTSVYFYNLGNIEIFSWDLYQYGDTYKVSVSEYDDGNQITTTHTNTSTFTNEADVEGGFNIAGIIKFGGKAKGSHTETKTATVTSTSTDNTDILGECFINFFDNIYSPPLSIFFSKYETFQPHEKNKFDQLCQQTIEGNYLIISPVEKLYNTGTIQLSLLPLKKK